MAKQKKRRIKNPVAKNMETFCRPSTHRDKTKYNRQDEKNKGSKDPYFLTKFSDYQTLRSILSYPTLRKLSSNLHQL